MIMKMARAMALLSALLVSNYGHPQSLGIVQSVGKGLTKEVAAVKTPLTEVVATVGSSQCPFLLYLFELTTSPAACLQYEPYQII